MLAAFLAVSLLVIVTPGPDTALTIRNTLVGGRRSGVLTALGVATGQAVWALATSAGVAALLVASEPVFAAVKLAGAAYLVLLGLQALSGAFRPSHSRLDARGSSRGIAPARALRQGLVSNLGNPKMAVFFTSLLPQFAHEEATFASLLILGLAFCLLTLAWLSLYAAAVAKAGDLLRRPRIRRTLEGITGAVLFALGLRLAAETR
ncbi:MAG: LysE family translocator [Gaiellaceae bacterium MAG52_C11]|nr:LysE family translocator [Candidatus Gaiellasilicea maunaloa]